MTGGEGVRGKGTRNGALYLSLLREEAQTFQERAEGGDNAQSEKDEINRPVRIARSFLKLSRNGNRCKTVNGSSTAYPGFITLFKVGNVIGLELVETRERLDGRAEVERWWEKVKTEILL